jgi:signal transduction histidine kinase
VLDAARELTGARYAALGVLDESRRELERFLTRGIDAAEQQAIGELPRGRGILGLLIAEPQPLRLRDIHEHPRSYGFPANHPPMRTFLGVPISIRGDAWGNLYLTDKESGEAFTAADEQSVVILADWAAVAIENASLYLRVQERRDGLERAVHTLEATSAIARAIGTETQLDRVLELIVKRGRALVDARAMLILLRDGEELTVATCAGEVTAATVGRRIPQDGSTSGDVMRSTRPERIRDVSSRLRISAEHLGVADARTALLVPLEFRSRPLGVLVAFDRIGALESEFTQEQEELLLSFAASAATAVATAQTVEQQRLRESMSAAEQERRRWARELHDETLQGLASFQVLLRSALRRGDPEQLEAAVRSAVEHIGTEIEKLRTLITELRPAALDELGLQPAIESLASRISAVEGIEVESDLALGERLPPDIETAVYRLVQEALSNVAKHAGAERVTIEIAATAELVEISVRDDGTGFDPQAPRSGFGITGMRERVGLCDGVLEIESEPGAGTLVRAQLRIDAPGAARVA